MPFTGKSVGKRLAEQMVKWATEFERVFPALLAEAQKQRHRWLVEQAELRNDIDGISPHLNLRVYDGERALCWLDIRRGVTPKQAKLIAEVLADDATGSGRRGSREPAA